MAMLRSAMGLASRQGAPASRFFGNVGRRDPVSNITSKRNYYNGTGTKYDLRMEDFTNWNTMGFLFGCIGLAVGHVFYHKVRSARYNVVHCEKISGYERGHYGQDKTEKKELSKASMSN